MAVRIVARFGGGSDPRGRFFLFSGLAHVLVAVAIVIAPAFGSRGPAVPPSITVGLVGGLPSPPAPAGAPPAAEPEVEPPAAEPEPPPPAEEPKADQVAPRPVEPPKTEPKPAPKKREPQPKKEAAPPKTESKPRPAPADPPKEPPSEAGSGSGAGAGSGAVGDAGSSISPLGGAAGDVALGWYEGRVTSSLYRAWRKPLLDGLRQPLEVHVAFDILRDGTIRDLRIVQSSGVPTLDRSAYSAVRDATPLPPLPPNWREPVLPATFVFRLNPS